MSVVIVPCGEQTVECKVDLVCFCGNDVSGEVDKNGKIVVSVCSTCRNRGFENGRDQGFKEGKVAGMKEAKHASEHID